MKLAEALILRSDLETRLQDLRKRVEASVKVQEGDEPQERADDLFRESEAVLDRWSRLVYDINRSNAVTEVPGRGMTITRALAERERLSRVANLYRGAIQDARVRPTRFGLQEVKFVPTVDIAELQQQVDALSQRHQELDMAIQRTNWQVDLLESEE